MKKYIKIKDINIAYSDKGKGKPVLMVHGFSSFSQTWSLLGKHLSDDLRLITLDLKGFGYSDKIEDGQFSALDHAEILAEFINQLGLKDIILIGHSFGGAVCVSTILNEESISVSRLILINSAGYFVQFPFYIEQLRVPVANRIAMNLISAELLARTLLEQLYHDKAKIDDRMIQEYAKVLSLPGSKECLLKNAENASHKEIPAYHDRFKATGIPILLIWGLNDKAVPVANAYRFKNDFPESQMVVIPDCGHCPQEEQPEKTASIINEYLSKGKVIETLMPKEFVIEKQTNDMTITQRISLDFAAYLRAKRLKMASLIDRWTPSVLFLFAVIKGLQLLRKIGFTASEGGWRKAAKAYLRTEHSKFSLGVFRLDHLSNHKQVKELGFEIAKRSLIKRLSVFLKKATDLHWQLHWTRFWVRYDKLSFIDIISADFDDEGKLVSIEPYFDSKKQSFMYLDEENQGRLDRAIVDFYNRSRSVNDKRRPWVLKKSLKRWIYNRRDFSIQVRKEAMFYVGRVLSGTFIHFDIFKVNGDSLTKLRFTDPEFIKSKHPGFGLLNLECRFSEDFKEADLWFQYNHVPVDGMPMQEILHDLKKSWGVSGDIKYPAPGDSGEMIPQKCSTEMGKKAVYQGRMFIDFTAFLKMRKELNNKYAKELKSKITIMSMLTWGLAHHPCFKRKKFFFPIDIKGKERAPGAVMISPYPYINNENPIQGFLAFQKEFNTRLHETRAKISECYELLEVFALNVPYMYSFVRRIMPGALAELTGTTGITMIRDSDLFVTPLSDLHHDGFLAFGSLSVPSVGGGKSGSVSMRGSQKRVIEGLEAVRDVALDFNKYI